MIVATGNPRYNPVIRRRIVRRPMRSGNISVPRLKNRKRERFALEVAAMVPLDRAYIAAGYSNTPWARYNACKLAHAPEVAERIQEFEAEFQKRSEINAEYIKRLLLPLVAANARDLFEDQSDLFQGERLKPIRKLPRDLAAAVSKIKCDPETGRVTEVVLHNKIEAGSLLLRSVGGLVDRRELTGRDGEALQPIAIRLISYEQEQNEQRAASAKPADLPTVSSDDPPAVRIERFTDRAD